MIINLICALLLITSVLLIVSSVYIKKLIPILIVFIFCEVAYLATFIPNYIGYSVDSKFVEGKEATVMDVLEGTEYIYYLVQFQNEKEPRLVKVAMNDANKSDADKAKEQSAKGLAVIKFGDEERGKGNGTGNDTDTGHSVKLLDLEKSQSYGKVVQSAQ